MSRAGSARTLRQQPQQCGCRTTRGGSSFGSSLQVTRPSGMVISGHRSHGNRAEAGRGESHLRVSDAASSRSEETMPVKLSARARCRHLRMAAWSEVQGETSTAANGGRKWSEDLFREEDAKRKSVGRRARVVKQARWRCQVGLRVGVVKRERVWSRPVVREASALEADLIFGWEKQKAGESNEPDREAGRGGAEVAFGSWMPSGVERRGPRSPARRSGGEVGFRVGGAARKSGGNPRRPAGQSGGEVDFRVGGAAGKSGRNPRAEQLSEQVQRLPSGDCGTSERKRRSSPAERPQSGEGRFFGTGRTHSGHGV